MADNIPRWSASAGDDLGKPLNLSVMGGTDPARNAMTRPEADGFIRRGTDAVLAARGVERIVGAG